jgi:dihydroflavonol-4-reductase
MSPRSRRLKPRPDGSPATEEDSAEPEEAIGPYKASKTESERLVEALVRKEGLPAVIVNPSTPIGPYDRRPTPTGRIILEAARGKMPAYVETGLNLVHVADCAAAAWRRWTTAPSASGTSSAART